MAPTPAENSFAALGGKPIVSAISAIHAFDEQGWDSSQFFGKANSFSNPLGEEFGHGYVLMTRDSLDGLNTSTPLTLTFGQGGTDESIDLNGIYIRTAVRITPGASQADGALYLVELVDTRYYLRRKSINKHYNCRNLRDTSSAWATTTLNSGTPWTWPQIITDLWGQNLALIGSIGALPVLTDLTSTPENLRYEGVSAWAALCDVCRRCGCDVVYDNAFANNFYVVRYGRIGAETAPPFFNSGGTNATKEGIAANFSASPTTRPPTGGDGLIEDEEVLQGDSMIPKLITVLFPTEYGTAQISDELVSVYGKWYPVQIDGSNSGVLPSSNQCPFNDALGDGNRIPRPGFNANSELLRYELITARFASNVATTPTNLTALQTRAKEIAKDIYRTIHDCAHAHVVWMGIQFGDDANPVIPGKTLTEVVWGDFGEGFRTDYFRDIPRLLPDQPYLIPQPGGGGASGGGGGGTGSGGCDCCDCLDCVDLCTLLDADVVLTCSACPNQSLAKYKVNVGDWVAFPDLGSLITVTYVSGCIWESGNVTDIPSGGVYKWRLIQAGSASSFELIHVSGADPVGILAGYWQIKWVYESDLPWSCLCNMQMTPASRERFNPAKSSGLNCQICLKPSSGASLWSCPTLPPIGGVVPCIPSLDFPAVTFGGVYPARFVTWGFDGNVNKTVSLVKSIHPPDTCPWQGARVLLNPTADHSGSISEQVLIVYNTGNVTLEVDFPIGVASALYSLAPDWVIGNNTLSLVTNYDPTNTTWPATITVTLTDCHFSSSHADYGYGCGYGGGSIGGSCTGTCGLGSVLDADSPTGYSWGIDTTDCSGSCYCGGSTQVELDAAYGYPTGPGQTLTVSCVPIP